MFGEIFVGIAMICLFKIGPGDKAIELYSTQGIYPQSLNSELLLAIIAISYSAHKLTQSGCL